MSQSQVIERLNLRKLNLGRFSSSERERNKLIQKSGLCAHCYELDFDQFSKTPPGVTFDSAPTRVLISLFTVIKNYKAVECKFCTYLFEAIALKRHDPLEHSAVKGYMPESLVGKNFEWWATHISRFDKVSPFGHSRNKIIIEKDPNNPDVLRERRDEAAEAAKEASAFVGGAAIGATTSNAAQGSTNAQSVASSATSVGAMLLAGDNKSPVEVCVKLHKAGTVDAGLIEINLWGYGNRVNAPLTRLSSFNLRIASSNVTFDGRGGLVYGKTIGDWVDLQGDCRTWLRNCTQHHHDLCAEPKWAASLNRPLGQHFRLIEIGESISPSETEAGGQDNRREYACRIVSAGGIVPRYAALSYVWGETGAQSLNLHVRNLARLRHGINDEDEGVAKTISDAITVAKEMGFDYLWVDSLCVIQQDGHNVDGRAARESQLAQMDSIFAHATVVLVAAAGHDADAGLVGVSASRELDQTAREIAEGVNVLLPVDYDKSYGKWDTRGWTLQEKLLSKRLLVFGERYVSFHCRHGIMREDMPAAHAGPSAGPPPIPCLSTPPEVPGCRETTSWNGAPVLLRSPFFSEYAKLLEQYTGRNMTHSGDIIVGISGLLRVLESMRSRDTPGKHTLYGLPEEFLDLALLWQPPAVETTYLARRESDTLPSWSWAGWEINRNHAPDENGQQHEALPGVRFEDAFWVSGNDDMSLRKFTATGSDAEERYKPLVMWFKWLQERPVPPPRSTRVHGLTGAQSAPGSTAMTRSRSYGRLVPVNGCGLGVKYDGDDAYIRALERVLKFRGLRLVEADFEAAEAPDVAIDIPLTDRHLVCETQRARFRLRRKYPRKEPIWHIVEGIAKIQKVLEISEAEILDERMNVVGHVIPTDQRMIVSTDPYDFILLSEAQYWGNEKRIDIVGYPLYNIMLVEWDKTGRVATRTGLGKIAKPAWDAANQGRGCVILK